MRDSGKISSDESEGEENSIKNNNSVFLATGKKKQERKLVSSEVLREFKAFSLIAKLQDG